MKFKVFGITILSFCFLGVSCSSLDVLEESSNPASLEEAHFYTAAFYNYDSSFLYNTKVKEGDFAIYRGPHPTRAGDDNFDYEFTGWDKALDKTPITQNTAFYAQYNAKAATKYNVQFLNYDGSLLYETRVREGRDAIYVGEVPTRPSAGGVTYTFSGWNKPTSNIREDTAFLALFDSQKQKFLVKFVNYDDAVLDLAYAYSGDGVTYTGPEPTRPPEGPNAFAFSGWDADLSAIYADTVAKAQYKAKTRTVMVTFVDYDGSYLGSTTVDYGKEAVYSGATPSRPAEGRYQYVFAGWSAKLTNLYSDIQVTAQYEKVDREATPGLYFDYDDQTQSYIAAGFNGRLYNGELFIPKYYNGSDGNHKVTRIAWEAFRDLSDLKSVFIEDNVTTIEGYAFAYCNNLEEVRLPEGLVTMGDWVFPGTKIKKLSLPKYFHNFTSWTFRDMNNLSEFIIDELNPYYQSQNGLLLSKNGKTLHAALSLNGQYNYDLSVPEGVTTIASQAVFNDDRLLNLSLPSTLEYIGNNAFSSCHNLRTVTFHDSPCAIDDSAFSSCGNLRAVDFGKELLSISNYSFDYCTALTEIYLPKTLTSLSSTSFRNCSNVSSFEIDAENPWFKSIVGSIVVDKAGKTIYYILPTAKALTLDEDFQPTFDAEVWRDHLYTNFEVAEGNPVYSSENGMLFNKDKTRLLLTPKTLTSLNASNLPSTVTTIGEYACYNGSALKTLNLSDTNVAIIGGQAFQNCYSLSSVTFPSDLQEISGQAFFSCSALTSIAFPSSLRRIGGSSFSSCGLKEIHLPDEIPTIESNCFSSNQSLKTVDISNLTSVTTIPYGMFQSCNALQSVVLPDCATRLEGYVFAWCNSLTSVTLPSSLQAIGYDCFIGCNRLSSIALPSSVTEIGNQAFQECYALTEIDLSNVTSISSWAFCNCTSLKSVNLKEITQIYEYCFANCTALKTVLMPHVTQIDQYAFQSCNALRNILVSDSLTNIGSNAFSGVSLNHVYFSGTYEDYQNCIVGSTWGTGITYFYSVTEPGEDNYHYWHYSDTEEIEIWR